MASGTASCPVATPHRVVDRPQASTAPRSGRGRTLGVVIGARRYFPAHGAAPRSEAARATIVERLAVEYPGRPSSCARCVTTTPFQLLAATILSAQCTDEMVNSVTPALFARYPDAAALAAADPTTVEEIVHATGFFRQKTKSLIGMATAVRDRFDGEVPTELDDLVTLPGVGRKTGNVLRSVAFGLPGLPVDTHVGRLATRLKLTTETDPVKVELDLNALVAPEERGAFSLRLILHGRRVCVAAQAAVRRVPARRHLPVGGQAVSEAFDVRPVEGDDFEQYFDVRSQSFGVSRADHDALDGARRGDARRS